MKQQRWVTHVTAVAITAPAVCLLLWLAAPIGDTGAAKNAETRKESAADSPFRDSRSAVPPPMVSSVVEEFVDPLPGEAGVAFANTHTPAEPTTTTTVTPTPTVTTAAPVVELAPPISIEAEPVAGSVEELICSYPWDCATALRVATCESGLNPGAVGSAGERGLLQIHPVHAPRLGERWHQLFTPAVNVQVAFEMWQTSGWQPWSCF